MISRVRLRCSSLRQMGRGGVRRRPGEYRFNLARTTTGSTMLAPVNSGFGPGDGLAFDRDTQKLLFSTAVDDDSPEAGEAGTHQPKLRPWQDSRRLLSKRVSAFTESNHLKAYDFVDKGTAELLVECCRKKNLQGMQWAHDILDRLIVEKRRLRKEGVLVTISVDIIQRIIYGWAVQANKARVARRRMEELVELAVEEAIDDEDAFAQAATSQRLKLGPGQHIPPLSRPTVDLFNTLLLGLSRAATVAPLAALACEEVLSEMQDCRKRFGWHTKPNTKSFTHAIDAFNKSQRHDAGENALRLLRRMQEVHDIDAQLYFEEYGVPYDEMDPTANKRHIVTADKIAYTSTMSALVKNDKSAEQVMELLREILESETMVADERVFTVAIKAFGCVAEKARSRRERLQAAERAEEVLWFMVEYMKSRLSDDGSLSSGQKKSAEKGLLIAFNSCLDAWARCYIEESAPRCEELLQKMLTDSPVKPDTISFNSCLLAWSKSHKTFPDAAARADEMLKLQHELSDPSALGSRATPDFQSYTIAILAHASSDDPDKVHRARQLLDSLLEDVKAGTIEVTRNPAGPFTAVINAAAKSASCAPGASETTGVVVDGFTSVIDTADNAYAIAERTYQEVRDDSFGIGAKPDHFCYGSFLQCIAKHTIPQSSEREGKARMIFQDACEAGECSRLVMDGLKATVGTSVLSIPQLQADTLPRFWTRNVPRVFRYKP